MAKKKLVDLIIDALEDIKARDIRVINVSKLTSMFDHIAVCSGDSNRQTRALANNVVEKVKEAGYSIVGSEGEDSGEWVLVDCGDVVVHIMQPVVREYYKLEELWQDGKLEFPKPARKKPVAEPDVDGTAAPKSKRTTGTAKSKTKASTKDAAKPTAKTTAKPGAKARPKAGVASGAKATTRSRSQAVAGAAITAKPRTRRKVAE